MNEEEIFGYLISEGVLVDDARVLITLTNLAELVDPDKSEIDYLRSNPAVKLYFELVKLSEGVE